MADEDAAPPEEVETPLETIQPEEETPVVAEAEDSKKEEKDTKTRNESLTVEIAPEEPDLSRTRSNEQTMRTSTSAEVKGLDEELTKKRKSRQGSGFKQRASMSRDESVLKDRDRRISTYRPENLEFRKSRVKNALGSIIDIRRSSVGGEVLDKRTARYMNTYKLESDNPFNPEKVDKILESVMMEALENLTYDIEKCPKQAKWASMAIRARVKALDFDRYKIICIVTIGEKHSQDVLVTCRFLWDAEKDRYSTFSMENTYVFGIAQCFGLYYE